MTPSVLIEQAENEIRKTVRDGYFIGEADFKVKQKVDLIIRKTVNKLPETMKRMTAEALANLFYTARRTMLVFSPTDILLLASAQKVTNQKTIVPISQAKAQITVKEANLYGVPNRIYSKEYIKRQVVPILNRLAEENATVNRQSLRNKAEMQARQDYHDEQMNEMKSRGVRLVMISVHSDCSDRCKPYQGKVFSLDGTYGKTDDGKKYEPIENAINVPARSKSGKAYPYFNGLFGFNCRHYMIEYRAGMQPPIVPRGEDKKQYEITKKLRQYERTIRKWKSRAEMMKGIDQEEYSLCRKKAIEWNKAYKEYAKKTDRAYDPYRTTII